MTCKMDKRKNIYFNGRDFRGTKFCEIADSRNLWDLLLRMVKLIFANNQTRRNSRDKFLRITSFKKYEIYFLRKKSFLRSKDVKIRVQIFFLIFASFIFANAWIWRILRDLFSQIWEIIFLGGFIFPNLPKIRENREN